MNWQLEGATTPQDIIQLVTENPLPPSEDKWHSIFLRDEDGIIELYKNISNLEKIKAVGEKFSEHSGMDSLYVNICRFKRSNKDNYRRQRFEKINIQNNTSCMEG